MDTRAPVIFAVASSEVGGSQHSLALLLSGLDRRAFPPHVILGDRGPLESTLRALGVPYEISPRPMRTLGGARHFIDVARREGARILHLFAPRTLAVAARTRRMAVVERVNILRGPEAGGFVASAFLDRTLLRLAHRVIVPSRAMHAQLIARGVPAQRVCLVPNGIRLAPTATGADAVRIGLAIGAAATVVLCVGRLVRMKGQDVLIDAMAAVRRERPDAVVVLAGDGADRDAFESRARAAGVDARWLGNRADVSELLSAADVYVQPSRSESFGCALHEAMLAGRAVVATAVGGMPEIVRHDETGLLVPAEDAAAMARAILALAGDPDRRSALGRRARAAILDLPDVDVMCRRTEAAYREALSCV